MLSTLPDLHGILGPPIALMASAPANVYRSAYVRSVFLLNYISEMSKRVRMAGEHAGLVRTSHLSVDGLKPHCGSI